MTEKLNELEEKEEEKFWKSYERIKKNKNKKKLLSDKRGQMSSQFSIFTFIIMAFVAVVLFGGMIYVSGILNDAFHDIGMANEVNAGQPGYTNMSYAADVTFGSQDDAIQSLRLVAAVWILGFAACIMITNLLIKASPLWFFAYCLLSLLAVILAVPISNAYQELAVSGVFGGELTTFTLSNWILSYLPLVTIIVGVLGGIFLFVNMVRTSEVGILP
jgi:predicted membrane channel-forming protein YqfA (hemolysin III family)